MIRLTTNLAVFFIAATAAATPLEPKLQRALETVPVSDLLGTRAFAREIAARCDQVILGPTIEQNISSLAHIRDAEFEAITSLPVMVAARAQSDAFEAKYGFSYNLSNLRRSQWADDVCDAAVRETQSDTLIGLMLELAQ